ncbi:MAG TPA: hypothetical protein VFK48_01490 [Usitatibacter sp.]|nr:hypothetical protein [Usitatibacter sp.]
MTAGPLHPDNIPAGRDRSLGKGHGTESLGPSDSSDSGSDLKGAPGLAQQVDGFGLDHGPVTDLEESFADNTAGPDVGSNLDIDTDRIESIPDLEQGIDPDEEDEEGAPRRRRH